MIFWVFYAAAIVLCSIFADSLGEAYLWYCIGAVPTTILLTLGLSLLLGRTNQYQLVGIRDYFIRDNSPAAGWFVIDTGKTLREEDIDKVVYVPNRGCPAYVRVYRYGLVGWRALWLMPVRPDRYEYILYLPKKDET